MSKYCIHCGKENDDKVMICSSCKKRVRELDEKVEEYLFGKVDGKIQDSIFNMILSFLKRHLYGTILTLTIVGSVTYNVVTNKEYKGANIVSEVPKEVSKLSSKKSVDYEKKYLEYLEDEGYVSSFAKQKEKAGLYSILDINHDGKLDLLISTNNGNGFDTEYLFQYDESSDQVKEIFHINTYSGLRYKENDNLIVYTSVRNMLSDGGYGFYTLEEEGLVYQYGIGYENRSSNFNQKSRKYYKYHGNDKDEIEEKDYNESFEDLEFPVYKKLSDLPVDESKYLVVGSYKLKYGKYSADAYVNGTSNASVKVVYELKDDKTITYFNADGTVKSVTKIKVSEKDLSWFAKSYKGVYAIEFEDGGFLAVPSNNTMEVVAGANEQFKYIGE